MAFSGKERSSTLVVFPLELYESVEKLSGRFSVPKSEFVRSALGLRRAFDEVTSETRQLSLFPRRIRVGQEEIDPYFASVIFSGSDENKPFCLAMRKDKAREIRKLAKASKMEASEYIVEAVATWVWMLQSADRQNEWLFSCGIQYSIDGQGFVTPY